MGEHKHKESGASFSTPDKWTVKHVLSYASILELELNQPFYLRMWEAAKTVIRDWQCDFLQLNDNLEEVEDMRAVNVVEWAGVTCLKEYNQSQELPKN